MSYQSNEFAKDIETEKYELYFKQTKPIIIIKDFNLLYIHFLLYT